MVKHKQKWPTFDYWKCMFVDILNEYIEVLPIVYRVVNKICRRSFNLF